MLKAQRGAVSVLLQELREPFFGLRHQFLLRVFEAQRVLQSHQAGELHQENGPEGEELQPVTECYSGDV